VIFQEAQDGLMKDIETIRDIYPYGINEPRTNAFGTIVLSKFPVKDARTLQTEKFAFDNIIINFVFEMKGQDISVYTLHPPPPTSNLLLKQRTNDLALASDFIEQDKNENIIMTGDWNLSPYSPYFADVLQSTGIKYQYTSLLPFTTWPSQFQLPFLQIPIDHILSKGNLQLTDKHRGPAMGSDHYPIVASFKVMQN
jgi:endonuclease/exonuclease/phosphatase (EEP) superfamily protein YafD